MKALSTWKLPYLVKYCFDFNANPVHIFAASHRYVMNYRESQSLCQLWPSVGKGGEEGLVFTAMWTTKLNNNTK